MWKTFLCVVVGLTILRKDNDVVQKKVSGEKMDLLKNVIKD